MSAAPRYKVMQAGRRWVVVDTHAQDMFVASKQSEDAARRECRDWNEFNGPPARGLAELLVIDPKRRRR